MHGTTVKINLWSAIFHQADGGRDTSNVLCS